MPGLVREVRVGRNAVDFNAQALEITIGIGQVFQFGRADEGEIRRIEEHDGPLAMQVGFGDIDELAVLEGGRLERLSLRC